MVRIRLIPAIGEIGGSSGWTGEKDAGFFGDGNDLLEEGCPCCPRVDSSVISPYSVNGASFMTSWLYPVTRAPPRVGTAIEVRIQP